MLQVSIASLSRPAVVSAVQNEYHCYYNYYHCYCYLFGFSEFGVAKTAAPPPAAGRDEQWGMKTIVDTICEAGSHEAAHKAHQRIESLHQGEELDAQREDSGLYGVPRSLRPELSQAYLHQSFCVCACVFTCSTRAFCCRMEKFIALGWILKFGCCLEQGLPYPYAPKPWTAP